MTFMEAVTWEVARAGGLTAYLLTTAAVAMGLALSLHWQTPRWPRIINNEMHNFLTLLALVFTCIHVVAVIFDPYTKFGLNEVFIPLASHYRPVWMAFGIVGLYLGLAIGLSTWLRPLIGYTMWRRLHTLTLLIFALVTVHGITTGTDSHTWWAGILYGGSILLVGGLLWQRLLSPVAPKARTHPVLATLVVIAMAVGIGWMVATGV
jgi:predicted ferric reductase